MPILSPQELRARQQRINAVLRTDQVTIGVKPATIPEISRAPLRSPKKGVLAKKRAARAASR